MIWKVVIIKFDYVLWSVICFMFFFMILGICDILNGGCGEICVLEIIGCRCECDIGL